MEVSDAACRVLAGLLEARTGQQLTMSRRWRIETALRPLLRQRAFDSPDQLISAVAGGCEPGLADEVVAALLNNETFFYRDRAVFEVLFGPVLSRLERARSAVRRLSIWCAGCSTGQEAYSIAMSFAERPERWAGWTIDILGTDVSQTAIDQARGGVYSQFEVQRGLPVLQMMRWFEEEPGTAWRLSAEIQRKVRFQVRNLLEPPPHPGRFDVILCRNVLLYFSDQTRRAAFDRLALAAAPDGVLMLGAGETVIGQTDRFSSDPECRGLYIPAAAPAAPARAAS